MIHYDRTTARVTGQISGKGGTHLFTNQMIPS